tara:strand:+ start:333179 stop:333550 length:372 start_codon:yes stop_codon:yes gene_type:complete
MKASIRHQQLGEEFYTSEQCHITELSNSIDDPEVSIARARVAQGVTTRWHRLSATSERYYILSGQGRVEIGELTQHKVSAGDIVLIPPMCRQRIANVGEGDLVFLAICTPPFSNDAYEDLEEE